MNQAAEPTLPEQSSPGDAVITRRSLLRFAAAGFATATAHRAGFLDHCCADTVGANAGVDAVTFGEVRAAATRIGGGIVRTPCIESPSLSQLVGAQVHLKFENSQRTNAFKERGALNKLLSLTAAERARGVIAMSAGNHAQGVACHAQRLGVHAVIVMPKGTPATKILRTQALGAEVVLEGDTLADAARYAHAREARDGFTFIHPYDDPIVIAGQGTVAMEMLNDVPDLGVLVVPIGGGGLIAGCAVAAKAIKPGIQVIGVESKNYSSMYQRLKGMPVQVGGDTIAEGLATQDAGTLPLAIARRLVDDVLVVEEATIERAVATLVEVQRTVAEGAGAAALAAVLQYPDRFAGKRVGIPITGGNIDSRLLSTVLMRSLAREGRLVWLRVSVPERASALAKVASIIAAAGCSIVDVQMEQASSDAHVKTSEIDFLLETRDRDQLRALVDELRKQGIEVVGVE